MTASKNVMGELAVRIAIGATTFCLALAALFAVNPPEAHAASATVYGSSGGGTKYWTTKRWHTASVTLKYTDQYVICGYNRDSLGMSLRTTSNIRFTGWKYWACGSGTSGYYPDGRTKTFGTYPARYFYVTTTTSTSNYGVRFSGTLYY